MAEPRIAQIGCGHWGKNLTRNFAELGVLTAVVEANGATADQMKAAHGCQVMSWKEVLETPEIDAVSLATPASSHATMALEAIAAGKHVYVEKPLALSTSDARKVIDAADKAGRIVMVGHLLQYHPVFLALSKLVRDGKIGTLQYVYSNRLSLGKFRTEENVLWSFAPHDLSMILALAGSSPVEVTAQGASFVTPDIADWCTVQLQFADQVRGHVTASWLHPYKEHRLVAIGEGGMLVFEDSRPDWNEKLAYYGHSVETTGQGPLPVRGDPEFIAVEKGEPLRDECSHFISCIRDGKRPRTDGREGLAVLECLQRAESQLRSSLATGASSR